MKKILAAMIACLMMVGVVASAEPVVQTLAFDVVGVRMALDDELVAALQSGAVRLCQLDDETVRRDGVAAYMLFYDVAELSGLDTSNDAALEAWLNDNGTLLGGVVTHEAGAAGVASMYPDFEHLPLGTAGSAAFTLLRPREVPSAGEAATTVWAALDDEGRFDLFDPSADYGVLGAFSTTTLTGEPISNAVIGEARMTIVNLWATFCQPCIVEMPVMGQLAGEYAEQGVRFLGVVTDAYDADTTALAQRIIAETGADYPHILPVVSDSVLSMAQYVPTTLFLDSAGRMIGEPSIGSMDEALWRGEIEAHLAMLEG